MHKNQRTSLNQYRVNRWDFTNCPICGVCIKVSNLDGHTRYKCSVRRWKKHMRQIYESERDAHYSTKQAGLFKRFKDWMVGK